MEKQTKYQQIIDFITKAIQAGDLKTGQRIPSVRQLAKDFSCSKDTVQRALLELTYQYYLYAKPQSGYYVLEQEIDHHEDIPIRLEENRFQAFDDFRTCINETLIGRENYLFNYYSDQAGLPEVRHSIQRLLADAFIYSKAEQIVLTSGTQQALNILCQVPFPNQKSQILIEQPTYHRMNQLLVSQGLPYRTIRRGLDGIHLEDLETIFKTGRIKFFYTIPRYHFPLGHSYSKQDKEAILQLADRYDVYIVEDDYLGDLDLQQVPSFHYLDTNDRVIYIKSFSTSLFPALRIASMLLPQALLEPVLSYKSILDYDSNLIMQKALSLYIDNGMYQKNSRRLALQTQESMKERAQWLDQLELDLPFYLTHDGILLNLSSLQSVAPLKHSGLPLNFFEEAYLDDCPYEFTKVDQDNLERVLPKLSLYFNHPPKKDEK